MLADVRAGIWSELSQAPVRIDAFLRRELQRSYLTQANIKMNPAPFVPPAGLPPEFLAQLGTSPSDKRREGAVQGRSCARSMQTWRGQSRRQAIAKPARTSPMCGTRWKRSLDPK